MNETAQPVPADRKALRRQLRARRRSLSAAEQQAAARGLARQLRHALPLLRGRHVAVYLASDGEIDPTVLVRSLLACGKRCYLPRLHPDGSNRVWFMRYRPGMRLQDNRFGIPEPPLGGEKLPVWALNAILLPLVGFDRRGNRLGMGGGFYDRTLADRRCVMRRRLLIGLAHSLQEVPSLQVENWDIPLDFIATERELIPCRQPR